MDIPPPPTSEGCRKSFMDRIRELSLKDRTDFNSFNLGLYGVSEESLSDEVKSILEDIRNYKPEPAKRGRPRKKPLPSSTVREGEERRVTEYQKFIKQHFKRTYECNKHLTTQEIMLVLSSLWTKGPSWGHLP